MNTPLFLARRINAARSGKAFTSLIRFFAKMSIALSLAVMILSVSVVTGFQYEIRQKVIGFGGHVQILPTAYQPAGDNPPVQRTPQLEEALQEIPGVTHIQAFATKPGILKTEEDIHGVMLKGVDWQFNWDFFQSHIQSGQLPEVTKSLRSDEIMISGLIARKLNLSAGDQVVVYFVQDPPRLRRFLVSGIYNTGLEELDRFIVLGDIRHIQRLNDWEENEVEGFELLADNFQQIPLIREQALNILPWELDAYSISQLYPQLFDWLALLDMNVYVILFLMVLVAVINMITTLLITILERTGMIGILKALGSSDSLIRRMFLYHAAGLIGKGMFWGNIAGIGLALIQQQTGLIGLPQESYYMQTVPVNLQLLHVVLINAGTFLISMLMLQIPSWLIGRISPVKVISFR